MPTPNNKLPDPVPPALPIDLSQRLPGEPICATWLVLLGVYWTYLGFVRPSWICRGGVERRSRLVTEAIRQTNPRGVPIVLRRAGVAAVRCSARPAPNEGPVEMVGISSKNGILSARQVFRIENSLLEKQCEHEQRREQDR